MSRAATGVWCGVGAYLVWGIVPIYWKQVDDVDALQLLGHRVLWSFLLLAVWLVWSGRVVALREALRDRRTFLLCVTAAVLIGVNWFTFVWAVLAGFIVQTSLGYFITPLVSVLFGVAVFRERLRRAQWVAVGLAAIGVAYLTVDYGAVPWIALVLAASFGSYGLLKKLAPLGPADGLAVETGVLFLPAAVFLGRAALSGEGAFLHGPLVTDVVLVGSGLVTVGPLVLFATAVRRIPLSLVGLLQYIAPTAQFLLGVFLYREPFRSVQLIGFGCVWVALAVLSADGLLSHRAAGPVAAAFE